MARSVDEIQAGIITNVQATPELAAANSTSKRAIWRLWTYIVAVAINLLEQLMDIFQTEVETTVSLAAPQTPQWLQDKVFKFQYSATNPQVIQLINFIPAYPVVDTALRIVTRCSVRTTLANQVLIKVAKSEPPVALVSGEVTALQNYLTTMGVAGVNYSVSSTASDKLYVQATVYFQGQYSSVIQTNVVTAITAYLSGIPFDGTLKLSDLEIAIKAVAGVNDCTFQNVSARADSTSFGSGTSLVLANTVVSRLWGTAAGYIVGETTSSNTLNDTLTYIAE
jgi:hypothetical protein